MLILNKNRNLNQREANVLCDKCGKTCRISQAVEIRERKKGLETGRHWHLCPICRVKYYKKEIKEIAFKFDKTRVTLDDRLFLVDWNKEKWRQKSSG